MKNILFLHSSSELYGSDRSLLNLVKNLDKNEFNITVILPEEGPLVEEIKKVNNVNVLIKEIAVLRRKNLSIRGIFSYSADFLKSIKYLKQAIKDQKIDIVYTNTSVVFPGGIAARVLGKKSIWHVREIISNNFERRVVSFIVNKFSDIIIANSKATAEAISKNTNKIRVVYNCIENKEHVVDNEKKSSEIIIGMAGRINRWKGQKLFVDMAEMVAKSNKNVKFLIAGDAYKGEVKLIDDLKEYIKEKKVEDKVILLGQVNDMDSFYNSLDIFVLPSIKPEPFGLVIIEAMDRKLPVVATKHGGPLEIIEDNISGFLVDFNNAYEMSEIINKLIKDDKLREKIGLSAKLRRDSMFSLNNYVSSISEILEKI
ncbi:glycosyltransferase [Clostridium perfringens]|uniref:glycosyltransferase family 4 protein n=1 Tax=Clostridium perfringens TaxID=1502 RepID=UPI002AC7A053|nr:glycosyltransferase family 4 protein [Clostridium perfringens]MDZ4949057.1 glycosyltransferase [Clostridium perfringens]